MINWHLLTWLTWGLSPSRFLRFRRLSWFNFSELPHGSINEALTHKHFSNITHWDSNLTTFVLYTQSPWYQTDQIRNRKVVGTGHVFLISILEFLALGMTYKIFDCCFEFLTQSWLTQNISWQISSRARTLQSQLWWKSKQRKGDLWKFKMEMKFEILISIKE